MGIAVKSVKSMRRAGVNLLLALLSGKDPDNSLKEQGKDLARTLRTLLIGVPEEPAYTMLYFFYAGRKEEMLKDIELLEAWLDGKALDDYYRSRVETLLMSLVEAALKQEQSEEST